MKEGEILGVVTEEFTSTQLIDETETIKEQTTKPKTKKTKKEFEELKEPTNEIVNCLTNKRVIVKFIPKKTGKITSTDHVLYGGLADDAKVKLVVPTLSNGTFVNVLTKNEMLCIAKALNMDVSELSVYSDYWDCSNTSGVNSVTLSKQDTVLDLSNAVDYIKYKILLANKTRVAASYAELKAHPKETYKFVLVEEGETDKTTSQKMANTKKAYKILEKIGDDKDKLRTILEIANNVVIDYKSDLEFLNSQIFTLISKDPMSFLRIVEEDLFEAKVLLKKAQARGVIFHKGGYYYTKDGRPLCNAGQMPTFGIAASYISLPANQDIKFDIEEKVLQ